MHRATVFCQPTFKYTDSNVIGSAGPQYHFSFCGVWNHMLALGEKSETNASKPYLLMGVVKNIKELLVIIKTHLLNLNYGNKELKK